MGIRRPSYRPHPFDQPLDQHIGFASHVRLTCIFPVQCSSVPCSHVVIWLTSDLYDRLPGCITVREFQQRLKCSRCQRRGWVRIEAAGR